MNIMDKALRKASISSPHGDGNGPYKGDQNTQKSHLFSWAGGNASGKSSMAGGKAQGAQGGVAALQQQNLETLQALHERGEKLQQVNEKAAKMNDAAADFHESTRKLLQQQKSKAWF